MNDSNISQGVGLTIDSSHNYEIPTELITQLIQFTDKHFGKGSSSYETFFNSSADSEKNVESNPEAINLPKEFHTLIRSLSLNMDTQYYLTANRYYYDRNNSGYQEAYVSTTPFLGLNNDPVITIIFRQHSNGNINIVVTHSTNGKNLRQHIQSDLGFIKFESSINNGKANLYKISGTDTKYTTINVNGIEEKVMIERDISTSKNDEGTRIIRYSDEYIVGLYEAYRGKLTIKVGFEVKVNLNTLQSVIIRINSDNRADDEIISFPNAKCIIRIGDSMGKKDKMISKEFLMQFPEYARLLNPNSDINDEEIMGIILDKVFSLMRSYNVGDIF